MKISVYITETQTNYTRIAASLWLTNKHGCTHEHAKIHTDTHTHTHNFQALSKRVCVFPWGSVSPLSSSSSLYFLGDSCHPVRPMAAYSAHWHTRTHTHTHTHTPTLKLNSPCRSSSVSPKPLVCSTRPSPRTQKRWTQLWVLTSKSYSSVASLKKRKQHLTGTKITFGEIHLFAVTHTVRQINVSFICVCPVQR